MSSNLRPRRKMREDEFGRLEVYKIVKFADLSTNDQKKLPKYIKPETVGRIFFVQPMMGRFCKYGEGTTYDIVFELLHNKIIDYDIEITGEGGKSHVEKWHSITAHVHNCVEPDFSEIGTVTFDDGFKHRVLR